MQFENIPPIMRNRTRSWGEIFKENSGASVLEQRQFIGEAG